MAREGLLIEIDREVEELCRIAGSLDRPARDEIAAVVQRLDRARAAYPFTGGEGGGLDAGRDFRLSAEGDAACVALLQFATVETLRSGAYVSFSENLTDTRVLSGAELSLEAARRGEIVAQVPATQSLEEARANLIAGMAWQLEWSKVMLSAAEDVDAATHRRTLERVQYHLFGGP